MFNGEFKVQYKNGVIFNSSVYLKTLVPKEMSGSTLGSDLSFSKLIYCLKIAFQAKNKEKKHISGHETGKLKPPNQHYLGSEDTRSPESLEISRILEAVNSPPKITAEPPSAKSGVFKVPSIIKDCSTSFDPSLSTKPKSLSTPSSSN